MALNFSKMLGQSTSPSAYRKNQATAAEGMGTGLPAYKQNAATAGAEFGQFAPLRAQSGQNLYNRYAAGYDAGGLMKKKMLTGIDSQFAGTQARARANAAATGQSPAAILSLLDARRAQATSGALTDYANQKQGEDERYARGAYQTAAGMAGNALAEQNSALGNAEQTYGRQFSSYGNLAQEDEARQAASRQALIGMLQQGASLAAGMPGLPGMGGGMSAVRGVGEGTNLRGGATYSAPEATVSPYTGGSGMNDTLLRRLRSLGLSAGGY